MARRHDDVLRRDAVALLELDPGHLAGRQPRTSRLAEADLDAEAGRLGGPREWPRRDPRDSRPRRDRPKHPGRPRARAHAPRRARGTSVTARRASPAARQRPAEPPTNRGSPSAGRRASAGNAMRSPAPERSSSARYRRNLQVQFHQDGVERVLHDARVTARRPGGHRSPFDEDDTPARGRKLGGGRDADDAAPDHDDIGRGIGRAAPGARRTVWSGHRPR